MKIKILPMIFAFVAAAVLGSCSGNQKAYFPKHDPMFAEALDKEQTHIYETPEDMALAAMKDIWQIEPDGLKSKLSSGAKFHLIDVRETPEFNAGHIEGAMNIPRGVIEFRIKKDIPDLKKDDEIVIYCKTGDKRAPLVYQSLKQLGYENLYSLKGGWQTWDGPKSFEPGAEPEVSDAPAATEEPAMPSMPKMNAATPSAKPQKKSGGGC